MLLSFAAPLFFQGTRLEKLKNLPDDILVHDLAKGIPYPSGSIDAVYHSHFLEHLKKDHAKSFLLEVKRVLKPGGIQRIVVPDFEKMCTQYLQHVQLCTDDVFEWPRHDDFVAAVIDQMVRDESSGTRQQPPLRRFVENMILGGASKRGEVHRWMYDKINLHELLKGIGFSDISVENYNTSRIPKWNEIGLDTDESNNEYKPISMYVEAVK